MFLFLRGVTHRGPGLQAQGRRRLPWKGWCKRARRAAKASIRCSPPSSFLPPPVPFPKSTRMSSTETWERV
eukprot:851675-Rhodomonas_salina.1